MHASIYRYKCGGGRSIRACHLSLLNIYNYHIVSPIVLLIKKVFFFFWGQIIKKVYVLFYKPSIFSFEKNLHVMTHKNNIILIFLTITCRHVNRLSLMMACN